MKQKLRLIELFSGIGAQAKAVENLDKDGLLPNGYELYRSYDNDPYAVNSYNAIHHTNNVPIDITKVKGNELEIVDLDNYFYILTYSFPCTDISNGGAKKGMTEGSGTRSSLLWEIKRLLQESDELPQVLLMENVPLVASGKNKKDFDLWCSYLESLGYTNSYQVLDGRDYGVPQARKRLFMVSLKGNDMYDFPEPAGHTLSLTDILQRDVSGDYYLSVDKTEELLSQLDLSFLHEKYKDKLCICNLDKKKGAGNGFLKTGNHTLRNIGSHYVGTITARYYKGVCADGDNVVMEVGKNNIKLRRLTPRECFLLMGFNDEDYSHAASVNSKTRLYMQAGNSIIVNCLYHIIKKIIKEETK